MKPKHATTTATILVGLWAFAWSAFNIVAGLGEGPAELLSHLLWPAIMLTAFMLMLRWKMMGALALIAVAIGAACFFKLTAFTGVFLVAPPILAALLLLLAGPMKK